MVCSGTFYNRSRNLINVKNRKLNTYVVFNEVQICSIKRMQLELLRYLEVMIINSERVVEINNRVFFYHALINKAKMLKS